MHRRRITKWERQDMTQFVLQKKLCYSKEVIEKIKIATSENEITRILRTAREAE
jgi:hypothetical protein